MVWRYLYLYLLMITYSFPLLAGDVAGNGGQIVICGDPVGAEINDQPDAGIYSLDYIQFRGIYEFAPVDELQESFDRVEELLELIPAMKQSFKEYRSLLGNSKASTGNRIWLTSNLPLTEINDTQTLRLLPPNCIHRDVGDQYGAFQIIIRRQVGDLIYYESYRPYLNKIHDSPLQASFLYVHEWLWDYSQDAYQSRQANAALHQIDKNPEEIATLFVALNLIEPKGRKIRTTQKEKDLNPNQNSNDDGNPSTPKAIHQIAGGPLHTCALGDQKVWCWGVRKEDLGDLDESPSKVPDWLDSPVEITVGLGHSCAISDRGRVECWGWNEYGQIEVPEDITNASQISAGDAHTCVIQDQKTRCWGYNQDGQIDVPGEVSNPQQVSAGGGYTCSIYDRRVGCWGSDKFGQTRVPTDLINPRQIATGKYHACALHDEGVDCWGRNNRGQTNVPDDLHLKNPKQITTGAFHSCALHDQGIECWGWNTDRQREVPSDLSNPQLIAAGENHNCAFHDGGIRCWGASDYRQSDVPSELQWY